jgi:predicted nucleic acid-binding protein
VRVLIDTNVVLDFLLERNPFFAEAELIFQAIANGEIVVYISATTITDIFYISRKHTNSIERARQAVTLTLSSMNICPVNRSVLQSALNSKLADFEDAVQLFCAIEQGLDAILTRDTQGFSGSSIPVLSPQELLQQI